MNYSLNYSTGAFVLSDIDYFSPDLIFDCGQCFRFDKLSSNTHGGVALGRYITVETVARGKYKIYGFSEDERALLVEFFALDDDYELMRRDILDTMRSFSVDTTIMEEAMEKGRGIRLLHQERWECLCSFIISQNNNIPRIKKIISTISRRFGREFTENGVKYHTFPDADAIVCAGEEEIFACKTGFRAKYIMDAAKKATPDFLNELGMLNDAELLEALMTIKGVGTKVGSCVSLFGFGKMGSFPIDVWVRRVMEKYYPDAPSYEIFGKYAGLAQQYLFYYERYITSAQN